jgi:hypothetical protein
MKCKQCQEANLRSKVYIGGQTTTCIGFSYYYDEDGKLHDHDPNTITTSYSCSNGHNWVEETKSECISCKKK